MLSETVGEFLAHPRIAVLITLDVRGLPAPAPLWFEWDGHCAHMFSAASSAKVRRASADPRAWLVVHSDADEPEDWVVLQGPLALASDGFAVAQRLVPRYWDMSTPAAKRAIAQWESQAGDLVALQLVPARTQRFTPSV
jgi:nitroimidazol reductase NimA-like FMN-containing flavoprotein (pyridoxamine 5'-phosphate oxidase superfamily)